MKTWQWTALGVGAAAAAYLTYRSVSKTKADAQSAVVAAHTSAQAQVQQAGQAAQAQVQQAQAAAQQQIATSRYEGMLIKSSANSLVYVVKGGKKQWIMNMDVFKRLGFNAGNIVTLPPDVVSAIPDGNPLSGLSGISVGSGLMFN